MGRNEQRGVRSCIESQVDNKDGKGRLLPHPPDLRQQPGSLEQKPGRLLLLPVGTLLLGLSNKFKARSGHVYPKVMDL